MALRARPQPSPQSSSLIKDGASNQERAKELHIPYSPCNDGITCTSIKLSFANSTE